MTTVTLRRYKSGFINVANSWGVVTPDMTLPDEQDGQSDSEWTLPDGYTVRERTDGELGIYGPSDTYACTIVEHEPSHRPQLIGHSPSHPVLTPAPEAL